MIDIGTAKAEPKVSEDYLKAVDEEFTKEVDDQIERGLAKAATECPFCEFVAKSAAGKAVHIRHKHKDRM
jgi:hypothetical protein